MFSFHGRFVWYELTTTDMPAASAFYSAVVGWGARDASMPGIPYTVFSTGEVPVGGMMNLPEQARKTGERPSWIGYVSVDDVDATAARVKALGGTVHVEPTNVLDVSRFSVVSDPQMATLALFKLLKPREDQPADLRARGRVGWHELYAADWETAWSFYSEMFGWQKAEADSDAAGTYLLFSAAGQTVGGMYTKPPVVPIPFWLYYFNIGDIDAAAKRVKAGGGQILYGPVAIPGGNWIVQCTDPQGAMFALIGNNGIGYFERATPRKEARRTP